MGRQVSAAVLVTDQLDFFQSPGSVNRVVGIVPGNLVLTVFANNVLLAWPLEDGTLVPDSSVSAGKVYFNPIDGSPGFYAIRFFFDRIGFWRLLFVNPALGVEVVKEYDSLPLGVLSGVAGGGSNASFLKSC